MGGKVMRITHIILEGNLKGRLNYKNYGRRDKDIKTDATVME